MIAVAMKKVTDFQDLQCRKQATDLCKQVYLLCEKADLPADDELACRRHVATMNISGKIAFAFGPEEVDRFKKRLPLSLQYCGESLFRTNVALEKGIISKRAYNDIEKKLKSISKKIRSILKYLEKYGENEKYKRRIFFEEFND